MTSSNEPDVPISEQITGEHPKPVRGAGMRAPDPLSSLVEVDMAASFLVSPGTVRRSRCGTDLWRVKPGRR